MGKIHLDKIFLRFLYLLIMFVFLFMYTAVPVLAISPELRGLLGKGVHYYDPEACNSSGDDLSVATGQGAPDGTLFPNLDPAAMAQAIDNFIEKTNPNSKMKGLGSTIVAGAENSNINPFLIVSLANKESSLADPNDYNVSHGNNSFGRSATPSQPNFQGDRLWYKWSTVKASVDHTADENKNANGGGDIAAYLRVQYGEKLDRGDLESFMNEYAPPFENDTSTYISNIRDWMKEMIKLTGDSGSTAAGATGGSTTQQTGLDGSSVYMVGDSITEITTPELKKAFKKAGASPYINATGGSSITYSAGGMSGLEAVTHDKSKVANADVIIIAHGTSHVPGDLEVAMKQMMSKIKGYNNSGSIYWVNTFTSQDGGGNPAYTSAGARKKNAIIDRLSSSLGYTVIDAKSANIKTTDGIHPFNEKDKYAKTVVDGIGQGSTESISGNSCCPAGGSTTLIGSDNEAKVWNYFIEKGLSAQGVAGIMGNMSQESGFDPQNIQDPEGRTKDPSGISAGWGLIQWTEGSKILGIANEAKIKGPIYLLETQLDIVWWHMTTPGKTPTGDTFDVSSYKNIKDTEDATDYFEQKIEGAGDPQMAARYTFANDAFEKYNGRGVSPTPSGENGCFGGGTGTSTGEFIWPLPKQYEIGSCYGWRPSTGSFHSGLDIFATAGTKIIAADGGTVEQATDTGGGFGNAVVIKHSNGMWTLYGHMKSFSVKKGDKVDQGQEVGEVNSTGHSFGDHLHFNIQSAGGEQGASEGTLDPRKYLPDDGRAVTGSNC